MKFGTTLIAFFIVFLGFCQDYSFEWGDQIKTTTYISDIYRVNGNSFYALPVGFKNRNKILFYDNLTYKSTTEFENLVNGKSSEYEGTFEIGGSIYTFTSEDNEEKTNKSLYCYKFKESSEERKVEGRKIASFNYDKKNKRRSGFTLTTSENKQKFCVTYYSSSRKKSEADNGNYGYFIFDKNLELENEGGFDDVLEKRGETGIDYKLSNQGTLFLVTELVVKDEPTTIKFYKVTQNDINALELNLDGKYTNQLTIAVDKKENFVVSGFYGERASKNQYMKQGVRGVFFTVMNPKSQEILSSGFHEFDDAFIMEGLSNRQKERTEKKKEKKGIEPSLYNFKMRKFESTSDGGYVGIAEEYFVTRTTSTNSNGVTTTTYKYFYNDIIVFKLDKNGEMSWKKKIQKNQMTVNEPGAMSSIVSKQTKDKLYIIFNDNMKNYDPATKKFLNLEMPFPMTFSNKNNAIAIVGIALEDGKIERNALSGKKELGSLLVPKLCFPEPENSSILLYTIFGKKEMVGRISFND